MPGSRTWIARKLNELVCYPTCSFAALMKFGKTSEKEFTELGAALPLPPFPYRALKKKLKPLTVTSANVSADEVVDFFRFLSRALRRIDRAWRASARLTLFAASGPRAAAVASACSRAQLRRRCAPPGGVPEQARALNAWAALSQEGLRKIIKKFHKRCAASGSFGASPDCDLAFVRGNLRTQIEALARGTPAAEDISCPVCLEPLFEPVAPRACGHALCKPCYQQLPRRQGWGARCPVCRGPAGDARAMPVLASIVRSADPESFGSRKAEMMRAKQQAYDEKLAREAERYAHRARAHPMASMINQ